MTEERPPSDALDELPEADPGEAVPDERRAHLIIRNSVIAASAAGFVPTPVFDIGVVTAVQLKMLHSLAGVYGVPFERDMGASVIASLVGTIGANTLARGSFGSMVKIIPVIGTFVGAITVPIFAGATTYAVGKIFQQHFAGGGTFFDFDPARVSGFFREKYREGQDVARNLKDEADEELRERMATLARDRGREET